MQEELDCKELKLRLDAARYRFLKKHLVDIEMLPNEDPKLDRWEYRICIEDVLDSMGIDMSFDDAVDALMDWNSSKSKLLPLRQRSPLPPYSIPYKHSMQLYRRS